MATVRKDLIRESGLEQQYNKAGQLVYARYDRTCFVDDISGADPEMVQAAAVVAVKGEIPVGTPHPNQALALARYYRAIPVPSVEAAEVIVTYLFQFEANPSTFIVEMNSGLVGTSTDVEFVGDDADSGYQPILVKYNKFWKKLGDVAPELGFIDPAAGVLQVLRPVATVTMTKSVSQSAANTLEGARDDYLGGTNASEFRGKEANLWLCSGISTVYQPFSGEYLARLAFSFRPESWDEFARFQNAQLGIPRNLFRDPDDTYDQETSNGIKRCRAYPRVDLGALVALI